jgi:alpha-beta hydrolase superfamily lysophospholipase
MKTYISFAVADSIVCPRIFITTQILVMLSSEFRLRLHNETVFFRHWPCENPSSVVCIVHGLGEHCNRYNHFAGFFNSKGLACLGYDRVGHGRSSGKRGHVENFSFYLDEIDMLLQTARKEYPKAPVFLYGHSMGGNLVLNYVLRKSEEITGAIATGSWIRLSKNPSALLLAFARAINSICPSFHQPNGLDVATLSRDRNVVKAYQQDPLVHDRISVKAAVEMFDAAGFLDKYQGLFPKPLLLMHGNTDSLVDVSGTNALATRITGDITLKIWPDMFHEIHNETDKQLVMDYTFNWIGKHCAT